MKTVLMGLMLSVGFMASAQTISFDKKTIDYGKIEKGAEGHRFFTVTNTGDKPLVISKVQPSCGCTTPEWSQEPIMPGKSTKIKVGYNTNIVSPFKKLIEVYSNDPKAGRSVVWIQGEVLDPNAKK
ncbi:DUF1573 domain-containing protein [Riemerella columbina]|uniref:DUF1573 domain-containing protein n=1 Tax=Riemerella columbina TaxID=103810 RepID=UPI00266F6C4E|nr:DUF1573 domain-containing protein [Riemerella columbina]WKS95565.1 DUF1573 domain-containing protein [Riemerella columbina]